MDMSECFPGLASVCRLEQLRAFCKGHGKHSGNQCILRAILLALVVAWWPHPGVSARSLHQSPSHLVDHPVDDRMVAECRSGSELARAFADPTVQVALLVNDITLSASDFTSPIQLDRNFSVTGAYTAQLQWPLLDLGFVQGMVAIGPRLMLNFSQLVLVNGRRSPHFMVPGIDLMAFIPRNASQPYGLVVAWNCALIQRACLPDSLYRQSSNSLIRPAELPGPQIADRVQQWQPCDNDTSARPFEHCWLKMGMYTDIAAYGNDLVGAASIPTCNNYILWMHHTNYLCDVVMLDACVAENGLIGCYYVMFPDAANATTVVAARDVSPKMAPADDSRNSLLAPLLGGLLGGLGAILALAAVVVIVHRQHMSGHPTKGAATHQDQPPAKRVSSDGNVCAPRGPNAACCGGNNGGGSGADKAAADTDPCPSANSGSQQHPGSINVTQQGPLRDSATTLPDSSSEVPSSGRMALSWKKAVLACGGDGGALQQEDSDPCISAAGMGPGFVTLRLMCRSSGPQSAAKSSEAGPAESDRMRCCRTDDFNAEPVTQQTPIHEDVNLCVDLRRGEVKLSGVVLGKGNFGRVVEGMYGNIPVAVKLLNTGLMVSSATVKHAVARDGDDKGVRGREEPTRKALDGDPKIDAGWPPPVDSLESWASLAQEVEVLARCHHPNIVRLLAASLGPPQACLVMELMETSLEKRMYGQSGGTLELPMVLHIGIQIARALSYLHPTILHRDLKPANVLISQPDCDRPIVKLADFGLARLHDTVLVTKHPEVGTAPYMAPETFDLENEIVTDRVDIYAFGVIMWEMLAGRRPWEGQGVVQIAYSVVVQGLRLPVEELSDARCPHKLRSLILDCWDCDPARRPAAAEIYKTLALQQQQVLVMQRRP